MDLNCNAYRLERTQLDVRFAGVDYEHARDSFQKTCNFAGLLNYFCAKISPAVPTGSRSMISPVRIRTGRMGAIVS
jgi:hypothetical protein